MDEDDGCYFILFGQLWRLDERTFRFRVFNKQFVGLDGISVVAVTNNPTDSLTFEIVKESENSSRVRIKASNGFFLQVMIWPFILYLSYLHYFKQKVSIKS